LGTTTTQTFPGTRSAFFSASNPEYTQIGQATDINGAIRSNRIPALQIGSNISGIQATRFSLDGIRSTADFLPPPLPPVEVQDALPPHPRSEEVYDQAVTLLESAGARRVRLRFDRSRAGAEIDP